MLQAIRDRAQGWIAWLIVILISVPFALWGIQSYVGVDAEPIAATVNGDEITERDLDQRVQRARIELRERLGAAYDPEQFDDKQLRREVLDDMIREHLVLETSRALGMRASDQEVRVTVLSDPSFQAAGRFDKGLYETRLRQSGMVPAQFEDRLRQRLLATQLARALVASEVVTRSGAGRGPAPHRPEARPELPDAAGRGLRLRCAHRRGGDHPLFRGQCGALPGPGAGQGRVPGPGCGAAPRGRCTQRCEAAGGLRRPSGALRSARAAACPAHPARRARRCGRGGGRPGQGRDRGRPGAHRQGRGLRRRRQGGLPGPRHQDQGRRSWVPSGAGSWTRPSSRPPSPSTRGRSASRCAAASVTT